MPDTISSNLFDEFLNDYERGAADFAVIDGANSKVIKIDGGPLSSLEDLASRLPYISAAFLTQNGASVQQGFRCLLDGSDTRKGEEYDLHFRFNDFWFYFLKPVEKELGIRLCPASEITANKTDELELSLEKHFEKAHSNEPTSDARRPIKFVKSYLLGIDELTAATKLVYPADKSSGKIRPYWRSYRNIMVKPVLRALSQTFPSGI